MLLAEWHTSANVVSVNSLTLRPLGTRISALMDQPFRRRVLLFWIAAASLLAAIPTSVAAQSAAVAPATLTQLTARSQTIVRGYIISARVEPHPELRHLTTVLVTMRVERVLKGSAGETFTFRQFIWDVRDRRSAAGYRKGGQMLLLMRAPSRYGLSSPVGLQQGRFRITRDAAGQLTASNGNDNAGLLRDVAGEASRKGVKFSARTAALLRTHQRGPLPLQDLEEIISKVANQ